MTKWTIEGTIIAGHAFEAIQGRLVVEDGIITAIEETDTDAEAIISPTFINAHSHIGDSIAKDTGLDLELEALVAPPDGLKHRLLAEADASMLIDGMRRSLRFMEAEGTGACYDFREGGIEGVQQLREAADGLMIDAVAFGRGEPSVIAYADGYGASGASDERFETQRLAASGAEKPFGIHAGEVDSGDINPALDLEPDFLVHMIHVEKLHLERVEDAEVPVVCCPRSNLVTGVGLPPIEELTSRTMVALGTDNVMLNSPSMLREMELTSKLFDLSPRDVFAMGTAHGAALLDRPDGVLTEGAPARYVIFDGASDNLAGHVDPVNSIVRRACRTDIEEVVLTPIEPEG